MNAHVTHITLGGTLPIIFAKDPARQQISIARPHQALKGWTAHGRGNTLWLVSPPGWTEEKPNEHNASGDRLLFRFPMTSVVVRWSAAGFDGAFDASLDKFDTRPFGSAEPVPVVVSPADSDRPVPAKAAK